MRIKNIRSLATLAIGCFFLIGFAGAEIPRSGTIASGNTVFVGEQGLDITAAMQSVSNGHSNRMVGIRSRDIHQLPRSDRHCFESW